MEACLNGSLKIAEWLLRYNANVLQTDDEDWTAVDYLQEYINSNEFSSQNLNALKHFLQVLQDKQRKGKFLRIS